MRCSHHVDSVFFMLSPDTLNLSFSWGCRWQRQPEQQRETMCLHKKLCFFFVLASNFATFVLSLCLVGLFSAHEEKALSPKLNWEHCEEDFCQLYQSNHGRSAHPLGICCNDDFSCLLWSYAREVLFRWWSCWFIGRWTWFVGKKSRYCFRW